MHRRQFIVGDIHGNLLGLIQALQRAGFNYEIDELITIGDIVDGMPDSFECVLELLKIKHRIDIRGNHDITLWNWLQGNGHSFSWAQGGLVTAESIARTHDIELKVQTYNKRDGMGGSEPHHIVNIHPAVVKPEIYEFFRKQVDYYVDESNRAFVHAGYEHPDGLGNEIPYAYHWSRKLWTLAMQDLAFQPKLLRAHSEIFIGHTATTKFGRTVPMNRWNVWNVDTGAGYSGKVTIMNVETKEFWQSDLTTELYPDFQHGYDK